MTNKMTRRASGFTMVELLIAIVIIGILVTIIVPVLSNRASEARIAAAKADMEAIANAESQIALDTGYIVRFHVIDDSGAVGDNIPSNDFDDVIDSIRDEDLGTGVGAPGNPAQIFLDAKTGAFMPANIFNNRIDQDGGPDAFGWRGPYANFQRKLKQTDPPMTFAPNMEWVFGAPLDPWGNPYFLFVGGESSSSTAPANGGWVNEITGQLEGTFTYGGGTGVPADRFDRHTIISLGPNGLPGDGTGIAPGGLLGAGDDLMRAF